MNLLCKLGRHRGAPIGKAMTYGRRVLRIVACIRCDKVWVDG